MKNKFHFILWTICTRCYLEFLIQLVVDYFFVCGMGALRQGGWHVITYIVNWKMVKIVHSWVCYIGTVLTSLSNLCTNKNNWAMAHIITQPMNKCHVNKLSQKLTYERHRLFFHFLYQNFVELLLLLFRIYTWKKSHKKKSEFLCWKNGEILPKTKHCFVGFWIIRLTINGTI